MPIVLIYSSSFRLVGADLGNEGILQLAELLNGQDYLMNLRKVSLRCISFLCFFLID